MSGTPRKPSFTRAVSVISSGGAGEEDSVSDVQAHDPVESHSTSSNPFWGSTRKKLSLVTLCVVYFAANASFSVISPFFPGEAAEMGADGTVIGLIFGIYPLVTFVVAPYIGVKLPSIGAKFTLTASLFLCGGAQILFGFTSMLPKGTIFIVFCFLLRVVMAIGGAGADTACFAVVAGDFGKNLGMVMGALEIFSGLGIMAGPPIGGVLYQYGEFKLPFIVMGSLLLSTIPVVLFVLPEQKVFDKKEGSLLQTIKKPAIAVIASCLLVAGVLLSFLDPTLAPHLETFGLGPSTIGLTFLLGAGLYAVSAPFIGWISDRTGRTRVIMVAGVVMVSTGYLLLGPAPFLTFLPKRKVWLALVSMGLLGIALSAYLVPCMPDLMETAKYEGMPDDISTHGVMSGIFNSMFSVGAFIGPTSSGVMVKYLGFDWATSLLAGILAFQGICLTIFSIYDYLRKRHVPGMKQLINEGDENSHRPNAVEA